MSRRTLRVSTVAAALTAATALAGCNTSGGTAASYRDASVSTQQVQDAVRDIKQEVPTSDFDGASAAVFIVLGDELGALAKKHGVFASTDTARAAFKSVKNPSEAAVQAVQGSMNFSSLRESEGAQGELQQFIKRVDVKLNPRYGEWKKGNGPVNEVGNWITSPKSEQTAQPVQ